MLLHDYSRTANTVDRNRRKMARTGTNFAGHKLWTNEEDAMCRSTFPDFAATEKALPHRTRCAILGRCRALGLRIGHVKPFTAREQSAFRHDYQTMEWSALLEKYNHRTAAAIKTKARSLGIRRPRKPLKTLGDELLDATRNECFRQKLSMSDLDEFVGSKPYFRYCQVRRPNYAHIVRAIRELGGTIKIEWSEE